VASSYVLELMGAGNQVKKELQSKLPADVTLTLTPTSERQCCVEHCSLTLYLANLGAAGNISNIRCQMIRSRAHCRVADGRLCRVLPDGDPSAVFRCASSWLCHCCCWQVCAAAACVLVSDALLLLLLHMPRGCPCVMLNTDCSSYLQLPNHRDCGSMHDDELLVHEHLALHNFRSPYSTTFRAKPPSAQRPELLILTCLLALYA
jgi:hypothetical protein